MITYEYICDGCAVNFEVERSIHDALLGSTCPECGEDSLRQVFGNPFMLIYSDPKTVGHLAARNTKKIGYAELQERQAIKKLEKIEALKRLEPKHKGEVVIPKEQPRLPWWRSGKIPGLPKSEKPLDANKFVDKKTGVEKTDVIKKYIETGNT